MPQTAENPTNGWTPERRALQAARIRIWAPWARSTGPKTAAGKRKSAQNAYKHGGRSVDMRLISNALSAQSRFLRAVKNHASSKNRPISFWANELLVKRLYMQGHGVTGLLCSALGNGGRGPVARK